MAIVDDSWNATHLIDLENDHVSAHLWCLSFIKIMCKFTLWSWGSESIGGATSICEFGGCPLAN